LIPVYQTRFGGFDSPVEEQGNCFQACVASILEIPLEDAFDAIKYPDGKWFNEFNRWLKKYNLACLAFETSEEKPVSFSPLIGYAIMQCKSATLPNKESHVVIIKDGVEVHDPNPHAHRIGECEAVYFFIPLDIPKCARRTGSERVQ